jgi:Flp pilus assembly protein TadD
VILQDAGHAMAEHRLYLPSVGFFLAIAAIADRVMGPREASTRRIVTATVAWSCIIAALAAGTLVRHRAWVDSVSIWRDAARKAPGTYMAQYGLAEAYRNSSDCANAIKAYVRAMEIRPSKADSYIGYAWCLLDQGQPERARTQLELAVVRAPTDVHANVALAVVEGTVFGDMARAADICRTVVRFAPGNREAGDCARRITQKVAP